MRQLDPRGIIPATVLPMKKDFSIDEDSLVDYVKWITRYKIGGLAINVDTGEGSHLTETERICVLEIVSNTVK